MELDDNFYRSKQIHSINYRPLRPGSNLVVETVRFNPSVCTCGKQCSEPHYRVESRVINKADIVDIKESMKINNENNIRKMKTDEECGNDKGARIDIREVISQNEGYVMKSTNGAHSEAEEIEFKSAFTGSLINVDVSGDSERKDIVESGGRVKSDVEVGYRNIGNMECVDEVVGIGDIVKCDVEIEVSRNEPKFEFECKFVIASKAGSIDVYKRKAISVKNDPEEEHLNVSYKEFTDNVTGDDFSLKNSSDCGHLNVVEFTGDINENDSRIKNGTGVREHNYNVRKVECQDDVSINQNIGGCEDALASREDDDVVIAMSSCTSQKYDHDVVDVAIVPEEITETRSDDNERAINVEIEEISTENTELMEEISAAFGIMSVYCNSELHSTILDEW